MTRATPGVRPLEIKANGFVFTGFSAGPPDGELVVLLHGWPQFADSWTPVVADLGSRGYRAVAFDQRGYAAGARPEAEDAYGIDHLTSDVLAVADALGSPRFHLVSHDWGAIVGWHLAAVHPGRLATFTALAVPHPTALAEAIANDPDQQKRGAYVQLFRAPGHVAEKALMGNDAAALRAAYEGKIAVETVDENVRRFREPGALTATLNWYRAYDWGAGEPDVTVPTLYVWGTSDRALGERAARNCAAHVTGPYRFEIVTTTHWMVDEIPGELVALILPHLARTPIAANVSGSDHEGKKSCPT